MRRVEKAEVTFLQSKDDERQFLNFEHPTFEHEIKKRLPDKSLTDASKQNEKPTLNKSL